METSNAEVGSSATMKFGIGGQGTRNADTLALAAGEGVRVTLHIALVQTHTLHQVRDPVPDGLRLVSPRWPGAAR